MSRRDAGMTLIEMIVTMAVIGGIAVVLATAATVTFRQQADTDGSLNVARWEQALALWLPTDLASADANSLVTDPSGPAVCAGACDGTSNALALSYNDGSGDTTVSYRYGPDPDGDGYAMTRVECIAGTCDGRIVLRDLAPPADPSSWTPRVDPVPAGVLVVSAPDRVDASTTPAVDQSAITVNVTVNGLPDAAGNARSSSVSITAGGVETDELDAPTFDGPSFVQARSGCGGPVTLLVDDSGSVVSEAGSFLPVRQGVESFVRAFEGTPTDLTVIRFDGSPSSLGTSDTSAWSRSFDLAEPSEVADLVGDAELGTGGFLDEIGRGGRTDWREALERAYLSESGVPYSELDDPSQTPELVVFFTDGLPTVAPSYPSPLPPEYVGPPSWVRYPDGSYRWRVFMDAWYSASDFLAAHRDTGRLVGVGISSPFAEGTVEVDPAHPGWTSYDVPVPVFLGDLVAGGSPAAYAGSDNFELVEYDPVDGWGDVSTAHVLTTLDMTNLGSGLAAIALSECGGTLTVQTRDSGGDPADAEITYFVDPEQVTTTRINKAGTFDIPLGDALSETVTLYPQDLTVTPYSAVGWSCRALGVDLVEGTDWWLVTPGDPRDGIEVVVTPNAAVSCTLEVT